MPSSLLKGISARSLTSPDVLRGIRYPIRPDFFVVVPALGTSSFSGANTGIWVFTAIKGCVFLGMQSIWTGAAASGTVRAKKVLAAATSAAGAAADANNVDISAAVDITLAINTRRDHAAVTTANAHLLAAGDKVALASAAGAGAGLSGATFVLQFAWM